MDNALQALDWIQATEHKIVNKDNHSDVYVNAPLDTLNRMAITEAMLDYIKNRSNINGKTKQQIIDGYNQTKSHPQGFDVI